MKKTFLILLYLFAFSRVYCQSNQPEIIATSGGYFKPLLSTPSLSWTIGENIVETYSSANNFLTQGFQQGHYNAVAIDESIDKNLSINVFPNPTTDFITISIKSLIEKDNVFFIELYDLQGKILYTVNYNQNEFKLDMLTYPAGTFLLKIMTKGNKCLQNFKIQKNK